MKLLIIEDDKKLAKNLREVLETETFVVDVAVSQDEATVELEVNRYDCLVLDINLLDGSGFELLKSLRDSGDDTPVIIVTARGRIEDRVRGLNLGADDYIPKPVDSQELIARVRAVIRRNTGSALPVIMVGDLTVKPAEHLAVIGQNELNLTAKEFAVLEYLAQYSGQVVTRTMLMEHVWGSDFDTFSNVIDVYIRNLRRKIEKRTSDRLIKTIRGKGYMLTDHEE